MDIEKFWADVLAQDADALPAYFHDDAIVNWHCTNERFSVSEFIMANCEYPGSWAGRVERALACGDMTVTATHVWAADDPSLSFHVVSFIKLRGDKIAQVDEYWGDDGPAPQWRLDKRIGTAIVPPAGSSQL